MDARQRAEKLNQIKHSTVGTALLEILREEEAVLREMYETQPAGEYNRGRLHGVQHVIRTIEGS